MPISRRIGDSRTAQKDRRDKRSCDEKMLELTFREGETE